MKNNELYLFENSNNLIPLGTDGKPKYKDIGTLNKILQTNPKPAWIETQQGLKYLKILQVFSIQLVRQMTKNHGPASSLHSSSGVPLQTIHKKSSRPP